MHAAPYYALKMHHCAYVRGDIDKNDSLWHTDGKHARRGAIVLAAIVDDCFGSVDVILSNQDCNRS